MKTSQPLPLVPVLGGAVTAAVLGYAYGRWRVRRPASAITPAPVEAHPPPAAQPATTTADEIAEHLAAANAMINLCERIRWYAEDLCHELRSPLTALRTELEEARLHPRQADTTRMIENALVSADRMDRVIDSILVMSRLQAASHQTRERFDLAAVVRNEVLVTSLHARMRPSDPVVVWAVREQIRQALRNLLDNAHRHARRTVEVEVRHADGTVFVIVDDDGDGVPNADRRRLIERFTRVDDVRRRDEGGTSLDLSLIQAITEVHGGTLHVEDSPIGGARFVLTLPAAQP
ncbi:sensor histidine kinase [Microbispora sp. ATCC PTA-5024]|uniref:sensor histidine kinase n=1 Tax=Microbispora sp. ATCC PTA-5024 TaxID=316330 RepID=UPI0003DD57C3|nr:HAMP domain-containing sensor histidine kinase [Microbispora sp. ATCC PTA-5024]ETK30919.1 hypothetical protein MPTA5024_37750 [Microbispora sp. ATCC PTA-5024]